MIKRKEVKTYMEYAFCECGGEMKADIMVLTCYPSKYPHICDRCGRSENYEVVYPRVVYEEVGEN